MIKIDKVDTDTLVDLTKVNSKVSEAIHIWFYRVGADLVRSAFREILRVPRHGRQYLVKLQNAWRHAHQYQVQASFPSNSQCPLRPSGYELALR